MLPPDDIWTLITPLTVGGVTSLSFTLYLYLKEYRDKSTISSVLGSITMHPVAALPILIIILWIVYKLVGEFGAGTCVEFLSIRCSVIP